MLKKEVITKIEKSCYKQKVSVKFLCKIFFTTLVLLGGENLHKTSLPTKGLLVVGNEAIGISSDLVSYMTQQVSIPSYRATQSFNVAVATAIICDRWLQDKPI